MRNAHASIVAEFQNKIPNITSLWKHLLEICKQLRSLNKITQTYKSFCMATHLIRSNRSSTAAPLLPGDAPLTIVIRFGPSARELQITIHLIWMPFLNAFGSWNIRSISTVMFSFETLCKRLNFRPIAARNLDASKTPALGSALRHSCKKVNRNACYITSVADM